MPYFVLFAFTIFCFSFIQRTDTKLKRTFEINIPFIALLVITFILFYGLRYDVGIDYMTYYKNASKGIFDLPQGGTGELFEPAFRFLYKIADFFELPPNTIFILGGTIIYCFLFKACFNYSSSIVLSVFIFFSSGLFFFSFNEFRQFIAVSIIFFGYKYCIERKLFLWIFIIFIAMLFHKSAFIAFPMFFICNRKYSRKFINLVLMATLMLKKIGALTLLCFVLSYLPSPYCNYAEVLPYMVNEGGSGVLGYAYILLVFILNNTKNNKFSSIENFFFNLFIVATVFLNIFSNVYMVTRLMEYYSISLLILYPSFYDFSKKNIYRYIFFLFLTVLFFFNFTKYAFFSPVSSKLEYHTVFNKER